MRVQAASRFFTALVLLVGITPPVYAQGTNAQLTGMITDATGAVIPNAKITVTNEATGIRRDSESNQLGYYTVALLPPGSYRMTVQRDGFRTINRSGITLEVDQVGRIDLTMDVGALAEVVEVTANASKVDTQTSTLKEVVDERRIRELPLNGRDATQLIFLLPGVYSTNDTSGLRQGGSGRGIVQPGVASNGARGNMVNYTLDGAFHNDTYTNVSVAMPNPDALQEFSVQTNNFSAEFGRGAGAVVNAVTRSGTNAPHGNLFEFLRNNALNANNYFATSDDGMKRHQFGGSLGGPVYIPRVYNGRDRTFFFFSHQESRLVQRPSNLNTTVLTEPQRRGDFSSAGFPVIDPTTGDPFPNNQVPMDRLNPLTRNIIDKILPLPTEPDTGLLWYSVPSPSTERQSILRADHQFGSKDTINARYLYNYFRSPANDSPLVFATRPQRATPSHNLSLGHTRIFGPTLLNQLQFAMNRRTDEGTPVWKTSLADLGMKNVYSDKPLPTFTLGVAESFFVETTERITTRPHAYTISDIVRWTKSRHEMGFGFEYRYQSLYKNYRWLLDPYVDFDGYATGYGIADFFLGLPGSITQMAYGEVAEMHMPVYSTFFQDNIRVSPRLTINVGLRFEPFIPYVDKGNRVSVFRPGNQSQVFSKAPGGLLFVGDPGVPRGGTNSDINNFAPRFGFAWSPFANNRTSIRGGYGIFYDASPMSAIANVFQGVAPFGTTVNLSPPPGPFDDPYAGKNPFPMPFPPPSDITFPEFLTAATYPPTYKTAYLQDWHLTVEREVYPNVVVRLGYAGSKGTSLLQGWDANAAVYVPGRSTIANTDSRRPYAPALSSVWVVDSVSGSNYHSLQASVDKRFGNNFSVLANYTWAKSIDYGSGSGTLWPDFTNPWDHSIDRGLSDFHRTHRFVTSGLWQLPRFGGQAPLMKAVVGGWSLAGVLTLQSGPYFMVRSGRDNSLSGQGYDRADLVGDIARPAGADPVRQWFNTAAFVQNAIGTFGNSGRNIVPGPGLAQLNFIVSKSFALYRESSLQFRAEFFNLTNHPNFIAKRTERLTSGTFGRLTSAEDPRIVQFGLKYQF